MKLGPGKQCGRQRASQRANLITEQFWPITNEVTHNHQKDLFFLPHLSPCACNSSLPPANFFNSLLNMKGLKIVVGRYKCCFCGFLHTHTHTHVLKKRVTSPLQLVPWRRCLSLAGPHDRTCASTNVDGSGDGGQRTVRSHAFKPRINQSDQIVNNVNPLTGCSSQGLEIIP